MKWKFYIADNNFSDLLRRNWNQIHKQTVLYVQGPILHENILIHILYEYLLFTYGQDFLDTLYILPDMDLTKTPGPDPYNRS